MPTPTTRLGLLKPSTADAFSTADLAANWQKIDDNPGTFICTSATRPSWTAAQKGREIMETDTLLKWIWTGSEFVRSAPSGLLKTTTGAWANVSRTTNTSTTSTSAYVVALTLPNVVVPAGTRTLMITATWPRVYNPTSGMSALGVFRTATANGTPRLASWYVSADNNGTVPGVRGGGGTYVTYDRVAAGVYTYTLQFRAEGSGTTVIAADAVTTLELACVEL